MSGPTCSTPLADVAMASFTLSIDADSGYQCMTEGRCTSEQYGAAMAALHGKRAPAETSLIEGIEAATVYVSDLSSNVWDPARDSIHYLAGFLKAHHPEVSSALLKLSEACDMRAKTEKQGAAC